MQHVPALCHSTPGPQPQSSVHKHCARHQRLCLLLSPRPYSHSLSSILHRQSPQGKQQEKSKCNENGASILPATLSALLTPQRRRNREKNKNKDSKSYTRTRSSIAHTCTQEWATLLIPSYPSDRPGAHNAVPLTDVPTDQSVTHPALPTSSHYSKNYIRNPSPKARPEKDQLRVLKEYRQSKIAQSQCKMQKGPLCFKTTASR